MKYLRYLIPTLAVATAIFVVTRNREPAAAPTPPAAAAPMKAKSNVPASFATQPPIGTRARCPVTDEEFTVSEKTRFATFNGRTYAFCCGDCAPEFQKDPAKYARAAN